MELEQELHHCRVELERLGGRKSQVRGQQSEGGNFVNNGRQKMASSVYELVKTSVPVRGHSLHMCYKKGYGGEGASYEVSRREREDTPIHIHTCIYSTLE